MLLELITGKRPVDLTNAMDESLVDWVSIILYTFLLTTVNTTKKTKKIYISIFFLSSHWNDFKYRGLKCSSYPKYLFWF